ncbi:hypothetical protein D3C74_390280 [compost metagenome]
MFEFSMPKIGYARQMSLYVISRAVSDSKMNIILADVFARLPDYLLASMTDLFNSRPWFRIG